MSTGINGEFIQRNRTNQEVEKIIKDKFGQPAGEVTSVDNQAGRLQRTVDDAALVDH